jgi:rhamnosyl/mannosyltransferase
VHEPNPLAVLALALRPPACPFVLWHHADFLRPGWARPLYAWLRRRLVRAAACVVVSNPTLAGAAYLREARRIEVIPFGIPLSAFADPDARTVRRARELRAARAAPLVLFVGRLVYYKGVDVLLDAMRDCRARLALIGTGAEGDALRALARRLRVDDRVEFLGDLPAEELAAWYQAADVFVLPSTHATEAFGVVQVEAMASGVPVVSTDLPTGVPWVNQHGVTGLVVPPGDAGALAAALTCLLDDPQLRRKLGAAARRRALEEFAEARMIARFDALLAEVCPDRP